MVDVLIARRIFLPKITLEDDGFHCDENLKPAFSNFCFDQKRVDEGVRPDAFPCEKASGDVAQSITRHSNVAKTLGHCV